MIDLLTQKGFRPALMNSYSYERIALPPVWLTWRALPSHQAGTSGGVKPWVNHVQAVSKAQKQNSGRGSYP
jgi:hypothetical protein